MLQYVYGFVNTQLLDIVANNLWETVQEAFQLLSPSCNSHDSFSSQQHIDEIVDDQICPISKLKTNMDTKIERFLCPLKGMCVFLLFTLIFILNVFVLFRYMYSCKASYLLW